MECRNILLILGSENVIYVKHYMVKIYHDTDILLCVDYNTRAGKVPDYETPFWRSSGDLAKQSWLMPDEMGTCNVIEYMLKVDMLSRCSLETRSVIKLPINWILSSNRKSSTIQLRYAMWSHRPSTREHFKEILVECVMYLLCLVMFCIIRSNMIYLNLKWVDYYDVF